MLDLSNLNEQQLAAVKDTEGAVLVLAGAGSGKTRVLTHRIAYLISELGVPEYNILAITFTNKAAAEMRDRLAMMLREDNYVRIGTFHSLCASILRRHADKLGYNTSFTIYDESDSKRVLKKAILACKLDGNKLEDVLPKHISAAKNAGLTPSQYYDDIAGIVNNAEEIRDGYAEYEKILKLSNAMDFDDLLNKTKQLFLTCEDVLSDYQKRFKYIHVDEFQDTNKVQMDIVKMLAGFYGNIFVVGDDDQSIYSWRGARVENVLAFDKEFTNPHIHRLEQNYRSTMSVLKAANNVIRNNSARHPKTLFSSNGDGVRVEYHQAFNDYQEVDYVLDTIQNLRMRGYRNRDFAILVRTNALTRLFENKLTSSRMRYRLLGGFRFFDRKEIQDVIAYMRAVANKADNEAVERIISFPKRGIGETTVERLANFAREKYTNIMDVLFNSASDAVPSGALNKLIFFRDLMADLIDHSAQPVYDFAVYLVERVGFEAYYKSTGKEEDETRWENIASFLTHISEWQKQNPDGTLDKFLETVRLAPERENEIHDGDDITLSTMHAVKGLEFKVVFIVACEEDIFPSSMSKKEGASGIEEERRVMYVAITRAKERLYITNAKQRFRFNSIQYGMPSRFIDESKGIVQGENSYGIFAEKQTSNYRRSERYDDEREIVTPAKNTYKPVVSPVRAQSSTVKNDVTQFRAGKKVSHPEYGTGTIIIVTGKGEETRATVAFERIGIKSFLVAIAPLKLM